MMRFNLLRSLLLCLVTMACAPTLALAEIDHSVARSVVQIRGRDPQGTLYYGSGVVIGMDQVVTNCHVVRAGGHIGVFRGAEGLVVRGERADVLHDLCILEVPGLTAPPARKGSLSQLKAGQPLYFYGYPRALGMSFSAGSVRRLHPFGGSRIIETSAFFTLGGSGGGVFDARGRLVGLATFMAPGHSGAYFAIPSEWVKGAQALDMRPIEPLQGQSFWEDVAHLPAFLKRPEAARH